MSIWNYKNIFDTILFAAYIGFRFAKGVPAAYNTILACALVVSCFYEFCWGYGIGENQEKKEQE